MTRELAIQVADCFEKYSKYTGLSTACVFGGVSDVPQKRALIRGVDILVATPGRLLDLINQRVISLKKLEYFVLDEADRMLDMGFIHDIRKVVALLPPVRQNLFFSATMPDDITKLASTILRPHPVRIEVAPQSKPIERINQELYRIDKRRKGALLRALLLTRPEMSKVLVFSRTKHGANRISETLEKANIPSAAIHGNKSQTRRQEALGNFKCGLIRVLVATDIAARGIDIDDVTHVINYDLPEVPETYVHRIGRTARAGKDGAAIAFVDSEEESDLRAIERITHIHIPEATPRSSQRFPRKSRAQTASSKDRAGADLAAADSSTATAITMETSTATGTATGTAGTITADRTAKAAVRIPTDSSVRNKITDSSAREIRRASTRPGPRADAGSEAARADGSATSARAASAAAISAAKFLSYKERSLLRGAFLFGGWDWVNFFNGRRADKPQRPPSAHNGRSFRRPAKGPHF